MIGIYKITSPSGRIYVGSSKNIERRLKRYKYLNCKEQPRIFNSLIKYGVDNHVFEILEECEFDKLHERELYYGLMFDVLGLNGLNCFLPKNGEKKKHVREESIQRMSEAKKGKKKTDKTKEKMSSYHKNRPIEHLSNLIGCNYKKLYQYNLNFELIKIWESLKEATDIGYGDIRGCITGRQKTAGGYIWSYSKIENINEYIKNKLNKQPKHKTRVILDLNTGVYYNSCRELCELINIQYHTMYSKLKGYHTNNTQYIFA
jgi:group I intron endonuclease